MKKLILLGSLGLFCVGFSGCSSKPSTGGGWVVGNPMMPEQMGQDANESMEQTLDEDGCDCESKGCPCSDSSN